jgi:hypothetical protein
MIVKQVDNEDDSRSYSPNSDFLLNTPYVPIIINETVSPTNESDRCRMLLQAMVYVRVGNHLRTSRNLVILCFYLNTDFEAERYLVYQASTDNTNRVCAPTRFVDYFDTLCRSRLFMIVNSHFLSRSRPSNFCSNSSTTKIYFQLY